MADMGKRPTRPLAAGRAACRVVSTGLAAGLLLPFLLSSLVVGASLSGHGSGSGGTREAQAPGLVPVALAVDSPGKYTVVKALPDGSGETVYDVAKRTLGVRDRGREIFSLNKDRPQQDGGQLTDPSAVKPGWVLVLPADATGAGVVVGPLPSRPGPTSTSGQNPPVPPPVRPPPPQQTAPAPATPSAPAPTRAPPSPVSPSAPPPVGNQPGATPESDQTPEPVDEEEPSGEGAGSAFEIPMGSKIRSISEFALGLLGTVAVIWVAFRLRSFPLAMANRMVASGALKNTLSLANQPSGLWRRRSARREWSTVESDTLALSVFDQAMRDLASTCYKDGRPVPDIYAALIDEQEVTLCLTGADLPPPATPWMASNDGRQWYASRTALTELRVSNDGPVSHSGFVTIGMLGTSRVLVDLARAPGIISLSGDPDVARSVAQFVAEELATSPWSRNVRVTHVTDDPDDSPPYGRLNRVDSVADVIAHLEADFAMGMGSGPSSPNPMFPGARAGLHADPLEVVVCGHATRAELEWLTALVANSRRPLVVLAVAEIDGAWRFVARRDGTLDAETLGMTVDTSSSIGHREPSHHRPSRRHAAHQPEEAPTHAGPCLVRPPVGGDARSHHEYAHQGAYAGYGGDPLTRSPAYMRTHGPDRGGWHGGGQQPYDSGNGGSVGTLPRPPDSPGSQPWSVFYDDHQPRMDDMPPGHFPPERHGNGNGNGRPPHPPYRGPQDPRHPEDEDRG